MNPVWQIDTIQNVTWLCDVSSLSLTLRSLGSSQAFGRANLPTSSSNFPPGSVFHLLIRLPDIDSPASMASSYTFFIGHDLDLSLNPYYFELSSPLGDSLVNSTTFDIGNGLRNSTIFKSISVRADDRCQNSAGEPTGPSGGKKPIFGPGPRSLNKRLCWLEPAA